VVVATGLQDQEAPERRRRQKLRWLVPPSWNLRNGRLRRTRTRAEVHVLPACGPSNAAVCHRQCHEGASVAICGGSPDDLGACAAEVCSMSVSGPACVQVTGACQSACHCASVCHCHSGSWLHLQESQCLDGSPLSRTRISLAVGSSERVCESSDNLAAAYVRSGFGWYVNAGPHAMDSAMMASDASDMVVCTARQGQAPGCWDPGSH